MRDLTRRETAQHAEDLRGPPTRRGAGPSAFAGTHVIVVQTSFLGDVVLTTPLLSALRRVLQPRRLTLVVRPEAVPMVAHHPCVDAVLVDDKRGRDRGIAGLLRVVRRLRSERADLAVSPHRSLRTALVLALAGIPFRVGFQGSPGAPLYHARVRRDRSRHDVERNLALLGVFGVEPAAYLDTPRLVPGPAGQQRAERMLADAGVSAERVVYGVCPGSVWPTKRWTAEGYGAVVRALREEEGAAVVLLGGSGDVAVGDAVQRHAGGSAINLVGRTDLATFIALVGRMRVVISNDSAPMHVAAALGVPVVAIFCATTPAQGYGPFGAPSALVEADLECRPCGRHGGRRCPRGTEDCMQLVDAGQVLRAVRAVQGGRANSTADRTQAGGRAGCGARGHG